MRGFRCLPTLTLGFHSSLKFPLWPMRNSLLIITLFILPLFNWFFSNSFEVIEEVTKVNTWISSLFPWGFGNNSFNKILRLEMIHKDRNSTWPNVEVPPYNNIHPKIAFELNKCQNWSQFCSKIILKTRFSCLRN